MTPCFKLKIHAEEPDAAHSVAEDAFFDAMIAARKENVMVLDGEEMRTHEQIDAHFNPALEGAVPDGAGGFVPSNSRVMPDGSLRPYDPAIDGMPGVMPDGPYPTLAPMPEPPTAYYDPPPPVYHAPRRRSLQTPWQRHDPNQSPEALPDTREWVEPQ